MSRAQQFEIFAAGALYNGSIISSGYAKFYAAGTTTAKNAYEDKDKSVSCTKIALDAQGRADVYGDGVYKIALYEGDPDDGGVLRDTIDNYKCTAVVGNRVTVTDDYTADRDDALVLVDTTSKSITISLDDVNNFDNPVTIKKIHANNTVTIDPYSTQTIDGDSTLALTTNNQTVTLEPDTTADIWRRTNHVATSLVGLTASIAELNIMDGVTAIYSELNVLDGITSNVAELNMLDGLGLVKGFARRPRFRFESVAGIYIGPGAYHHYGTTEQVVYWASELTFVPGPGGSNAGSTALGNNQTHHVYIDESAVVTKGSRVLDETCFINNTVNPDYSDAYGGYYNGYDRVIFGFRTDGSGNIREFFHDGGDFLQYADRIEDRADADLDASFTDVTLTIPGFCDKANCTFQSTYVDTANTLFWRTNGQTGSTGHLVGSVAAGVTVSISNADVITDIGGIIEIKHASAGGETAAVFTNGWYFPRGT